MLAGIAGAVVATHLTTRSLPVKAKPAGQEPTATLTGRNPAGGLYGVPPRAPHLAPAIVQRGCARRTGKDKGCAPDALQFFCMGEPPERRGRSERKRSDRSSEKGAAPCPFPVVRACAYPQPSDETPRGPAQGIITYEPGEPWRASW